MRGERELRHPAHRLPRFFDGDFHRRHGSAPRPAPQAVVHQPRRESRSRAPRPRARARRRRARRRSRRCCGRPRRPARCPTSATARRAPTSTAKSAGCVTSVSVEARRACSSAGSHVEQGRVEVRARAARVALVDAPRNDRLARRAARAPCPATARPARRRRTRRAARRRPAAPDAARPRGRAARARSARARRRSRRRTAVRRMVVRVAGGGVKQTSARAGPSGRAYVPASRSATLRERASARAETAQSSAPRRGPSVRRGGATRAPPRARRARWCRRSRTS